jgi:hypothetical protein
LFVVMEALPAVLLLLNETVLPSLLMIMAFPAELALLKFRLSLLVKIGANAELLTIPAPLMSKVIPVPLVVKSKAGAPAVNWIVLIEASLEIVTDVGAPLLVNVAVSSGTSGVELQLMPVVHSVSGPIHVPSTACATLGASATSAMRETPASSAARGNVAALAVAGDDPPDRKCRRVAIARSSPAVGHPAFNVPNTRHVIVRPRFTRPRCRSDRICS